MIGSASNKLMMIIGSVPLSSKLLYYDSY